MGVITSVDTSGISHLISLSLSVNGKHVAAVNVSKLSAMLFDEPDEVKAEGSVTLEDGKIGGYLTITIPNPTAERAGKWQCKMSALDVYGQPVTSEGEVDLKVKEISMLDIVSEINQLKIRAEKAEKDQKL